MKKAIAIITVFSLLLFNIGFVSQAYAEVEKIQSEAAAKELASNAGGTYIEGAEAPALTGEEVALPVIDESTGKTLGYIVAEKDSLVSALKAAGHAEVATALAAAEAGTEAGVATRAGITLGTIATIALIGAGVVGVGLALGSGGGGGTSNH